MASKQELIDKKLLSPFQYFAVKVLTSKSKLEISNLNEEKHMLGMLYYSFYLEAPEKLGYESFVESL